MVVVVTAVLRTDVVVGAPSSGGEVGEELIAIVTPTARAQSAAKTTTRRLVIFIRPRGTSVSSFVAEPLLRTSRHPVTETGEGPIGLFGAFGTVVVEAGTDPLAVVAAAFSDAAFLAAAFLAAALATAAAFATAADALGATVVVVEEPTVEVTVVDATVVVVTEDVVRQAGVVIVSESSVTAPFRASTRPSIFTPVVTVMLCIARIVPTKFESVPSVAELPTCQKTLQACAPLIKLI
jgi:hypothetical protein